MRLRKNEVKAVQCENCKEYTWGQYWARCWQKLTKHSGQWYRICPLCNHGMKKEVFAKSKIKIGLIKKTFEVTI